MTESVNTAFDVPIFWVNCSITMAPLVYIPMSFVATFMFNNMRRDTVLRIAGVIQILGAVCRMCAAINGSFWWIFAGSLILAGSAPFGFNAISIIANVWFGDA